MTSYAALRNAAAVSQNATTALAQGVQEARERNIPAGSLAAIPITRNGVVIGHVLFRVGGTGAPNSTGKYEERGSSPADFAVSGDAEFQKRFNAVVDRLRAMHPFLKMIISDIQNSKHHNQFIQLRPGLRSMVDGQPITGPMVESIESRQQGGTAAKYFIALGAGPDATGRMMSEEERVAHELWHVWSYNNIYGDYIDKPNPATGVDRDEEWAVRFQRLVPSTDGGRTTYGGVPIADPDYFRNHR